MEQNFSGERFLPGIKDEEMTIEHYQRYYFAQQFVKDKVVLDAACGEGYGSMLLSQKALKVIGLDIDEKTIARANDSYDKPNLSFVVGSIEKLPFDDDTFDAIISYETIEHVDDIMQRSFLREIHRVLKPAGWLLMSTPNKAVYTDLVNGINKFHIKEFYVQEYIDFLKDLFSNIRIFCQYPETGYFIVSDNQEGHIKIKSKCKEKSRYIIAVCSNESLEDFANPEIFADFSDEMYYFLYRRSHELENNIRQLKNEADQFQHTLESSIEEQKAYILQLEESVEAKQKWIEHLKKDISELKKHWLFRR